MAERLACSGQDLASVEGHARSIEHEGPMRHRIAGVGRSISTGRAGGSEASGQPRSPCGARIPRPGAAYRPAEPAIRKGRSGVLDQRRLVARRLWSRAFVVVVPVGLVRERPHEVTEQSMELAAVGLVEDACDKRLAPSLRADRLVPRAWPSFVGSMSVPRRSFGSGSLRSGRRPPSGRDGWSSHRSTVACPRQVGPVSAGTGRRRLRSRPSR